MADYNITLQFYGVTLSSSGMSIAAIARALEALPEGDKLDYTTGLKNEPGAGGSMTGHEIVDAINLLDGDDPLINPLQIELIPKERIIHGDHALNWIATADPRSPSFQIGWSYPSHERIKAWDFIMCVALGSPSTIFATGDWLIALVDEPGFTLNDASKWRLLKFSKLDSLLTPVFRNHATASTSGIESIGGASSAEGTNSFAPGESNTSFGEVSTALGKKALALRVGEVAESSGGFGTAGDGQRARYNMRLTTTNNIASEMVLPSKFWYSDHKTYLLVIRVLASVRNGLKAKAWEFNVLASRDSTGVTHELITGGVMLGAGEMEYIGMEFGAPELSCVIVGVDVDAAGPPSPTVSSGMFIKCTGEINSTVYWQAFVDVFESTNL